MFPSIHVMEDSQYLNFIAIHILDLMGNDSPTQEEIDLIVAQLNTWKSITSHIQN